MARRAMNLNRLMLVLGLTVLALGLVSAWAVSQGARFGLAQPTAGDRALRQVREQMGPSGEVRYAQAGEGRILCGYAGRRGEVRAVAFVSRPNRILFSDDPLPGEFRQMKESLCPGFPTAPPRSPS